MSGPSSSLECLHPSPSEGRASYDAKDLNGSSEESQRKMFCQQPSNEENKERSLVAVDKNADGGNQIDVEVYSVSSDDDDETIYLSGNEFPETVACTDISTDFLRSEDGAKNSIIVSPTDLQQIVNERPCLKQVLFRNHLAEPLSFLLLLHDFSMEMKLSKLIEECGGLVYGSVDEIDDYTIVLVKDDSLHWAFSGPVFKVSYITACIKAERIVGISKFFKGSLKPKVSKDFNHMDVVYFKRNVWYDVQNVDCSIADSSMKTKRELWDKEASSSDDDRPFKGQSSSPEGTIERSNKNKKKINKHSRLPYTREEDENIIKYIVKKKGYDNLKGIAFWKVMESREVCPQRTWQSMKEHFKKKIVYNLSGCRIISDKQKELLQRSFL